MTKAESIIVREATSLFKNETLLRTPVTELSDEEALFAWSCLDLIEKKVLAERKKELHSHLMKLVEEFGERTAEGHQNYSPEGSDGNIQLQCRRGKVALDETLLLQTLAARGFDTSRLMTSTVDEKKIEALVSLGEITPLELKECTSVGDPTYALIVKKPSEVEALLPKAKKALKKLKGAP
jgi:hypothetical protein